MLCCLDGVRVLEYTDTPAGAFCGKTLAALGAEVIKIEPPAGDPLRNRGPFFGDLPHRERSCAFFYLNLNKMGITLNLLAASGREILAQLAAKADVVIEDQLPDAARSAGLNPGRLLELNPRLVVGSVTPFGRTGPHSGYRAYPLNVYHSGGDGYLLQSGKDYLDREPVKGGGFAGEYEAAATYTLAVLAALRLANKTGVGRHVDVSKQEALMALNRTFMVRAANNESVESRMTRSYPYGGMLPCKDGAVVVQVPAQHMWQRLVAMMGNPAWAAEERFKDEDARTANSAAVNALLKEWLRNYTKDELIGMAREWSVPVAQVATAADVLSSEQLRARDFFAEVEHPVVGKVVAPSLHFLMAGVPSRATVPPPLLGQHNGDVFVDRLGYSNEDLAQLRCCGVI